MYPITVENLKGMVTTMKKFILYFNSDSLSQPYLTQPNQFTCDPLPVGWFYYLRIVLAQIMFVTLINQNKFFLLLLFDFNPFVCKLLMFKFFNIIFTIVGLIFALCFVNKLAILLN